MFRDRADAGRQLARVLLEEPPSSPVVLGLPRGGVVVAAPVADRLRAPLDVIVVRKLGHPRQPELAVGAIGEHGVEVLNADVATLVGEAELDEIRARERLELERRLRRYRGDAPGVDVAGHDVIVVDDGLATGATARAAVDVLRHLEPATVTLAVPVGPPSTVRRCQDLVDRLVCLHQPRDFAGVGQFYADFAQTTDDQVSALLAGGELGEA